MAQNIELKARLTQPTHVRDRIGSIATAGPETLAQCDTYFRGRHGRLKLREHPAWAELIWYERANEASIRSSEYMRIPVSNPMACKQLLAAALGEETVVEKVRELWWYKNVRIHVDDVARLGSFIEFEGIVDAAHDSELSRTRIEWLTRQLEIGEHDWIDRSYRELIMDKAKASS